jgi:hypothetical protein
MKLFFTIIFSLSLMSVFSVASAFMTNPTPEDFNSLQDFLTANPQENITIPDVNQLPPVIFAFIQIVQEDDNGQIIGYLESDRISVDAETDLNTLVAIIAGNDDLIYPLEDGRHIQVVKHTTPLSTDSSGLLATIQFNAIINNSSHVVAHISHDGMRMNPGEEVVAYWTFLRLI